MIGVASPWFVHEGSLPHVYVSGDEKELFSYIIIYMYQMFVHASDMNKFPCWTPDWLDCHKENQFPNFDMSWLVFELHRRRLIFAGSKHSTQATSCPCTNLIHVPQKNWWQQTPVMILCRGGNALSFPPLIIDLHHLFIVSLETFSALALLACVFLACSCLIALQYAYSF